ncbi:hypothetical protein BH23VER1_BH23VER1_17590 [soil metagenome]
MNGRALKVTMAVAAWAAGAVAVADEAWGVDLDPNKIPALRKALEAEGFEVAAGKEPGPGLTVLEMKCARAGELAEAVGERLKNGGAVLLTIPPAEKPGWGTTPFLPSPIPSTAPLRLLTPKANSEQPEPACFDQPVLRSLAEGASPGW